MTHQRVCRSVSKTGECVVIRPPGITQSLPLFTDDVLERHMTSASPKRFPKNAEQWIDHARDALRTLPVRFHDEKSSELEAEGMICGSGSLRGRDYQRTPRNRTYIAMATVLATFGLIAAGAAVYQYRGLPYWVIDKPAHYSLSDDERTQVLLVYLTIGITVLLFGCALQQWWQTVRGYGTFAVAIGKQCVLLAGSQACHGFYRRSLQQFVWIPQGLAVTDGSGTAPVFLIPATWFDEDAQSKVAEWYPLPPAGLRDFGGKSDFIQPKP